MHWIFIYTKKINYLNFFSDFKDITASTNSTSGGTGNIPLPNILLGVTNPFFGKALKHWPHIVKLGDHNTLNGLLKSPSKSNNGVAEKQKGMSKFKLDSKPGLYSSSKTLLDKDKGRNKENRQIIFDRLFNFQFHKASRLSWIWNWYHEKTNKLFYIFS